jgi:glycolate oxidase
LPNLVTVPEVIAAARANLPKELWDFASGGAGAETTIRRNRSAIERYAFMPRMLRGVQHRNLKTSLLGLGLDLPVLPAPVGSLGRYHPDGPKSVARVLGGLGAAGFMGGLNTVPMEDVMAAATGPMFYQIYVRGDREWFQGLVRRVEEAGYSAICITADSPVAAYRERNRQNRYTSSFDPNHPNLMGATGPHSEHQAALNWEDIAWLRDVTKLPLILKGVLTVDDALLAVEHGVDAVYVSNHGGQELDYAPATVDVLPSISQAVAGRAEVIVDGGFLRGTDILKGLALGADVVCIGKLLCWAVAAGGTDGLEQTLGMLRDEMMATMGMLGVNSLDELGPQHLTIEGTQVPPDTTAYGLGMSENEGRENR